jgi:hypothetical protein
MIDYQFKVIASGLSAAVIAVAVALAYSIPGVGPLATALSVAFGGGIDFEALTTFAENIILYHKVSDETTRVFNVL